MAVLKFKSVVQVSLPSLLLVLTVAFSSIAVTIHTVRAMPDPTVNPTASTEDPTFTVTTQKLGETLTCWIYISDVFDLFGYEFGLSWTTSVLQYQGAVYGYDGATGILGESSEVGSWLVSTPYPGYLSLAASRAIGIGTYGSGYAARITFTVLQEASSPLAFWKSVLVDSMAGEITHTGYDGSFIGPKAADIVVDGQVDVFDLVVVAIAWGSAAVDNPETPWDETEMWNPEADLTLNEIVDVDDLYESVYNWGRYAGCGT